MAAIMERALLDHKDNNAACATLREVYPYLDDNIARVAEGFEPARLREALTVADFPLYFNRVLSRGVYDRYEAMTSDWKSYMRADTVPDYSIAERYRFTEFGRPVRRREKEEVYSDWIAEMPVVQIQVDDYAKQLDFSNRILVNDDLGAFNDVINKMGDAGIEFESWFASALYDNALTQAALVAAGALYSGTGRLTTANLAIAAGAFLQRTDARGKPIRVNPMILVIPPILRYTANQILASERIAELATNGINPLRGAFQVKEDPYIAFVAPNIPWYLFADPAKVPGVTVARMSNRPGVRMYAKAPDKVPMSGSGALGAADWRTGSFLTGDIELSVETTIGARVNAAATLVGVCDINGVYYSSGTTP
jgi:hypothetical protein